MSNEKKNLADLLKNGVGIGVGRRSITGARTGRESSVEETSRIRWIAEVKDKNRDDRRCGEEG
ncbi:hypothetical protein CCACVL1_01600 [Corchorus capsularis]|uniref:Uncharacterized protein n=1 Tax=Corchorus capsularis TaxID=210143 RepID=A0A1R3KH46_COCAP|nr:hypothetical protein CCACVL1_01600 [Corchorus capsularis]